MKAQIRKANLEASQSSEVSLKEVLAKTELQTPVSLSESAQEYVNFKNEVDRIAKVLARLQKILVPELKNLESKKIPVDLEGLPGKEAAELNGFLQLILSSSRSLKLDQAKRDLDSATVKKIEPFIKTEATFDMDKVRANVPAAMWKKLEPFLKTSSKFDMKEAESHLDEKTLSKLDAYIEVDI